MPNTCWLFCDLVSFIKIFALSGFTGPWLVWERHWILEKFGKLEKMLENLSQTWKFENFEKMVNFCNCYFDFKFCKNIFFLFNKSNFGSVLYGPLSNTQCVMWHPLLHPAGLTLFLCVWIWKIWKLRVMISELWYDW